MVVCIMVWIHEFFLQLRDRGYYTIILYPTPYTMTTMLSAYETRAALAQVCAL